MISMLASLVRRFRRSESGNVTVEFALIFPAYMFFGLSATELAVVTMQQTMLERAVDMTVRDIRLGTGTIVEHDDIKNTICERALFIKSCSNNLRLEMIQQSAFDGIVLPEDPDCTDNSEEVKPVRTFVNGQSNELMILRACARIDPVFPTSKLAKGITDQTGQYSLTATTAFVQEPI